VEVRLSAIPGHDGVLSGHALIFSDMTGEKQADDDLKSSLQEKEVMLKEIHHRVKNNLQVVSSLLRMQSEKAADAAARDLFADSQHRVRAMAMVHEHLYQSRDLGRIDFSTYVNQLVQSLVRAYGPSSGLRPIVQAEKIPLNLDTAVPCGLMLTELVSNALKYAYPKDAAGPIFVGFHLMPDGEHYELMVSDQGVGLPAHVNGEGSDDTLGLRLVRLLSAQLGGQVRLDRSGGTKFVITFKEYRPDGSKPGRRVQ
jgi:two-component sensor histidine kinase